MLVKQKKSRAAAACHIISHIILHYYQGDQKFVIQLCFACLIHLPNLSQLQLTHPQHQRKQVIKKHKNIITYPKHSQKHFLAGTLTRESLVWASHNCTEDLIDGMIEATTQSSRNVDQVTGIFIFSYVIFGHTPNQRGLNSEVQNRKAGKSQPRVVTFGQNIRFYNKFYNNQLDRKHVAKKSTQA